MKTSSPRFGTPDSTSAQFVGSDLRNDYFYLPFAKVAIAQSVSETRLLTAFEETAHNAAMYDFAHDLYVNGDRS